MDGFIVRRGGTYVQSSGSSSSSSSSQPIIYNGNEMLTELLAGTITALYAPSIGWSSLPSYPLNGSVFTSCSTLKTVNFPDAVSVPDASWFSQIRSCLENVSMAKCETLGPGAFENCSSLKTVSFPVCTLILSSAFNNCVNLSSVYCQECISIYSNAFRNCSKLTVVNFPKCTTIRSSAFNGASGIQEIYLPNFSSFSTSTFPPAYQLTQLTKIVVGLSQVMNSTYVFSGLSNLIEISFPSCRTVGYGAFSSCSTLSYVCLNDCYNISDTAFYKCSKLSVVCLPGSSICYIAPSAFSDTPVLNSGLNNGFASIYVPQSLIDTYKTAYSSISDRFTQLPDNWETIYPNFNASGD